MNYKRFLTALPAAVLIAGAALLAAGCAKGPEASLVPLDYAGWHSTVDAPLTYKIPGHTQDVRKIYINEVGTRAVAKEINGRVVYEYPEGTVILKENFTRAGDASPNNLTVMIKDSDHPDSRGGWIWLNRDVSTGKERLFTDDFCFACHVNANDRHPYGGGNQDREDRDYVYYPWIPADRS